MKIGCFALVEPFAPLARQFAAIAEMGLHYADLTDNHDGATLGVEYGFAASLAMASHLRYSQSLVDLAIRRQAALALPQQ